MGKTIPLRQPGNRGARPINFDDGADYRGDKTPLPAGYRYTSDGSIEHIVGVNALDGSNEWKRLCSPIEFIATTEDVEKKKPGLTARIRTHSGHWHRVAFPNSALVGGDDLLRELMDHGLRFVPSGKDGNALKRLLIRVTPEKQARCVHRIGWHENTFVLPDEVFGQPETHEIVFQPARPIKHLYGTIGTLDGWKSELAALALGNSRLEFSLSLSFVGPLLNLVNAGGGGFHLRGESSTGKSTALWVAGSVWRGGGILGFSHSWRNTDNALEGTAVAHSDTMMGLDEIAEVDAKVAFKTAYMLANGQGKGRLDKDARLRANPEWRASFLSTGEISLASKIAEDGGNVTAGQEVRVIDIPADAGAGMGVFEDIHGFKRPWEFADALRSAAQRHYGHASREFLRQIVKDVPGIASEIRETQKSLASEFCPGNASGQVHRVAERFALVACAGELAIAFGILPWPKGTACKAAERCFNDWLSTRGGAGQREEQVALDTVLGFLSRYTSRFRPWGAPDTFINDCAGFVRDNDDGGRTFYVFKGVFQGDVCAKRGIDHERGRRSRARDTHEATRRKPADGSEDGHARYGWQRQQ